MQLVRDYLPQLSVKSRFQDRVVAPPSKQFLDKLTSAVQARNKLAHTGADPPDPDSLARAFDAVSDLLWLLDYYRGHEWAMRWVSQETREAFAR